MNVNRKPVAAVEELVGIYKTRVLADRNRLVQLPGRHGRALVLNTLMGFQVKIGRKRVNCPDLATARYIRIFVQSGVSGIRIPYDPTRTEELLPDLEAAFARLEAEAGGDAKRLAYHWRLLKESLAALG